MGEEHGQSQRAPGGDRESKGAQGASGEGRAGAQVGGSLGCPTVGLRNQQQDARKDRGDGGLFSPEKEQWSFFYWRLTFPKRGKASWARGGSSLRKGKKGGPRRLCCDPGKQEAFGTDLEFDMPRLQHERARPAPADGFT